MALLGEAAPPARAQTNYATLNGQVVDAQNAVIPDAAVTIISTTTAVQRQTASNKDGSFTFPSLQPGTYSLRAEHEGFASMDVTDLTLHTADNLAVVVKLKVGSVKQTVTVSGETTNDSPAISMTVTREFIENMPLNGRSFQDLIQLAPGTVSSQNGYYSINGQRTDSNNYTVDGVSANLGGYNNNASLGSNSGAGLSGSSPSQTILGTTQSLASVDSLQEFTIQTSGYAAEYGRNPGGQVQFTTRSGGNEIHGTLFEYFRNTIFDANSYENNYYGDPKTAEHQNDFGGTTGGPVIIPKLYNGKNKTFYFFSYEGLRLLLPAFESEYVPTQAFRNWASPNVQPFLNAAPLPSANSPGNHDGCTVPDPTTGQPTACDALFSYGYSYPSRLNNIGMRVDHNLGKRLHAFVRYADTPSSEIEGAQQVETYAINTHTWTAGLAANITSNLLDDLRFNYSRDGEEWVNSLRSVGGSVPWARNLLIPAAYDTIYAAGLPLIEVRGTSLRVTDNVSGHGTVQHQYQLIDSLTWTRGQHSLKFGGDWRRLTPTWTSEPYSSEAELVSLPAIQEGYASDVYISVEAPGQPVLDNLSLYAQDHWRISPRLSIDYGLRWEFNPPPGPSNGLYPATLTSNNLATAQLAPLGTPPFKTNYHSFAPRFGFAWNAIPSRSHPLTVRGGFGIFFDAGQSAAANAYTGNYPFTVTGPTQTAVPLPLSSAALAPPSLNAPLTPPYPYLPLTDPGLTLPYTEQWNLSIDEMVNAKNTLTASYVGNSGRKLLFAQLYDSVSANPNFTQLLFTNNGSQSSYNALQIQDTGRIASGLDLVASFTLAHALDNASNDDSNYSPIYGNSDYDVRRVFNLALNYQTSTVGGSHWMQAVTHSWLLANRFSTQSGYPVTNIVQSYLDLPNGSEAEYVPDLVPGVPIYLHGRAADVDGEPVPGNWRLNPVAFAAVPTDADGNPIRQGTLGRNYVRNPSFWTLNTALQRSFPIYERLRLNFRAEAFNVFNHPNLSNPDSTLSDTTFGELVGGSAATIGSGNALYAMGSARSLQFSLHLQF
jgi:hypothetical protein